MSDMGDLFNAHKKMKQEKRSDNREQSAEILARAGIIFESRNIGAHLIVSSSIGVIDFWPGTGKWIVRDKKKITRRGVAKLVNFVNGIL